MVTRLAKMDGERRELIDSKEEGEKRARDLSKVRTYVCAYSYTGCVGHTLLPVVLLTSHLSPLLLYSTCWNVWSRVCTVCDFIMLTFRSYRTNGTTVFIMVEKHTLLPSNRTIEERYVFRRFSEQIRWRRKFDYTRSRALRMRATLHPCHSVAHVLLRSATVPAQYIKWATVKRSNCSIKKNRTLTLYSHILYVHTLAAMPFMPTTLTNPTHLPDTPLPPPLPLL